MIGERIKSARIKAMLSQRSLGQKVGVSAQAISKYERNLDYPSSKVLLNLSKSLNVRFEYFFRAVSINSFLPVYRRKNKLGSKVEKSIGAHIKEWLERYLEIENVYQLDEEVSLPSFSISRLDEIEECTIQLRKKWLLGEAPIENLIEILEEKGIKVGRVEAHEDFDGCSFLADGKKPVIVVQKNTVGDRQRFSVAHELGHLIINLSRIRLKEKAANRFAGSFLVPKEIAYKELGEKRTKLDVFELHLLKHKYGLSMQGWIHRAKDLGIISSNLESQLLRDFKERGWNINEPGDQLEPEKPRRKLRFVLRAVKEGMISRSKANDILGKPIEDYLKEESRKHGSFPVDQLCN